MLGIVCLQIPVLRLTKIAFFGEFKTIPRSDFADSFRFLLWFYLSEVWFYPYSKGKGWGWRVSRTDCPNEDLCRD